MNSLSLGCFLGSACLFNKKSGVAGLGVVWCLGSVIKDPHFWPVAPHDLKVAAMAPTSHFFHNSASKNKLDEAKIDALRPQSRTGQQQWEWSS